MRETEVLCEYLASMRYEDLPTDVIETAKVAIRDIVGVAIYGHRMPWSKMAVDLAHEVGGTGNSTIWGYPGGTSAPYAALANGTAAHGIEMDDRHHRLNIHNGAATIPAAISVAEMVGASPKDLILAVVCGYEAAYRLARATNRSISITRFYGPSIRSTYGATAAASKVVGLDTRGFTDAFGVAGNMVGGLLEHRYDPEGPMVKRLLGGGWPSYSGVTSAFLAERGFSGPSTVLEGKYGLSAAFHTDGAEPDIGALTRDLGGSFEISSWQTKFYPSNGGSHSSIDAITELRSTHEIDPDAICHIEVGCSTRIFPFDAAIPGALAYAQHNIPFLIAASFFYDLRNPTVWEEEIWRDERVVAVAAKVGAHVDADIEELSKTNHGGVRVTLTMNNGEEFICRIENSTGTLERPPTESDLSGKYQMLASQNLDQGSTNELGAWIMDLEYSSNLTTFSEIIRRERSI